MLFLYSPDQTHKGAALLPLHPLCSFNNIENVKCSILPKVQTARSVAALARIEVINRCLLASGRLFRLPASGAPSARSSVNACQPLRGFPPPPSAWLRCATPSRRAAFAALDSRHKANPGCSASGSRQGLRKWAAPTLACFRCPRPGRTARTTGPQHSRRISRGYPFRPSYHPGAFAPGLR